MKNVNWRWSCRKRGYTLVEVIFAITIFAILILGISSLLKISFKTLDFTYKNRRESTNNYFILKYIENEIKKADYYYETNNTGIGIIFIYDMTEGKRESAKSYEYRYITYNLSNNKIVRNTFSNKALKKLNNRYESSNYLSRNIDELNYKINDRNLELTIVIKNQKYTKNIAIRAKKL